MKGWHVIARQTIVGGNGLILAKYSSGTGGGDGIGFLPNRKNHPDHHEATAGNIKTLLQEDFHD
jgi:hypothetical protein